MRRSPAAAVMLCLFMLAPAHAQGHGRPDSIYVPGKGYVEPGHNLPATRFGVYIRAPGGAPAAVANGASAKRERAAKKPKPARKPQPARTVAGYAQAQTSGGVRFDRSSSCLPGEIKARLAEVGRRFGRVTIVSA